MSDDYRDTTTGRFVDQATADADPAGTVHEINPGGRKKLIADAVSLGIDEITAVQLAVAYLGLPDYMHHVPQSAAQASLTQPPDDAA